MRFLQRNTSEPSSWLANDPCATQYLTTCWRGLRLWPLSPTPILTFQRLAICLSFSWTELAKFNSWGAVRLESTQIAWFLWWPGREAGPHEQWPKDTQCSAKSQGGLSGLSSLRSVILVVVRQEGWTMWMVAKNAQLELENDSMQPWNLLKQAEWQPKNESTYSFSRNVEGVRCWLWCWWWVRTTVLSQNHVTATLSTEEPFVQTHFYISPLLSAHEVKEGRKWSMQYF
jgi:hypothetical protein